MNAASQVLNHSTIATPTFLPGWGSRRESRVLLCPRPSCGGRMFIVDVALDETAAVCMLCARTVPVEGSMTRVGRS